MAWENPVTTWGQAGKTVPGAGDFNRIEGNIQHLQDTKETPAGAQAKAEAAAGAVQAELNMHKAENVTTHNVSRGVSNFAGSGQEVTIPHGLSAKPTSAYAFPTVNPSGYLGEVWIRMDATNLYIGNSGSFSGAMSWTAIG